MYRNDLLVAGAAGALMTVMLIVAAIALGPKFGFGAPERPATDHSGGVALVPATQLAFARPGAATQAAQRRHLGPPAPFVARRSLVSVRVTPAPATRPHRATAIVPAAPSASPSLPVVPATAGAPADMGAAAAPVAAHGDAAPGPGPGLTLRVRSMALAAALGGLPELRVDLAISGQGAGESVPDQVTLRLHPQLPENQQPDGPPLALHAS
ncbi:MAG: hypothetical protein QOG70_3788, partial [Solirubrobacteraceae bacterium]|nr:hypothetical protein [Solirubrobacteraceae bacterium]